MTVRSDRSLWLRILALIMALVLFVMLPVRAYATGLETVVLGTAAVEAIKVLLPVIAALGVWAGIDSGFFESVANDCVTAMTELGYVVDGMIDVCISEGKSYVGEDLIQAVRDWLFGTEVVTEIQASGAAIPAGTKVTWDTSNFLSASIGTTLLKSTFTTSSGYEYLCIILYSLTSSFTVSQSGSSYSSFTKTVDGVKYYYYSVNAGSFTTADTAGSFYLGSGYNIAKSQMIEDTLRVNTVVSPVTTTNDLTLGRVSTPSDTVEDLITEVWIEPVIIEYPETGNGGSGDSGDNNNKEWLIPVSVVTGLGVAAIIGSLTQDTAQTGETDIELETETDPDGGDSSGDGSGSDTGSGSGGTVVLNPNDYALRDDLKNFFPFCIPFDLYDFFSLLSADPVAPVIHWELQDLSGNVYSIDVDLSQWDEFAKTFRNLQLLCFVIGLAMASRKFIKW